MFSLREFVKDGFLKAVGKMADHQVILNAASWHEKGVLTEEDLVQIRETIAAEEEARLKAEAEFEQTDVAV